MSEETVESMESGESAGPVAPVEDAPSLPRKPKRKKGVAVVLFIVAAFCLTVIAGAVGLFFYLRNQAAIHMATGRAASSVGRYEDAIEAFDQALAVRPAFMREHDDVTLLMVRARAYRDLGDLQAALQDLNRILEIDPEQTNALLLRGAVHLDMNDGEASMADYESAIAQAPNSGEPYLYRGLAHLHFRRNADALADLTQAIENDDTLVDAFVGRGWVYFLAHDDVAARADTEAALELAPESVSAQALVGAVTADGGNLAKGLSMLNQAVSHAPDDRALARALHLRAGTHLAAGHTEAALSDAEQIVAAAPDWIWGYLLRGDVHLARDEVPQAQFDYQKAVDLAPDAGIVYVGRAAGYFHDGDAAAARADLATALASLPDHVPALVLRGRVAASTGDADAALADLDRALELDPTLVDAHACRADLYFDLEQWAEARIDYDTVLQARLDDWNGLRRHALAAMAEGDYADAVDDLDAAIALKPADADLIVLRAEAYLELDNMPLALRDAQRALDLDDDLPVAHFIVGVFNLEAENYFQAVIDLTAAIKLDPELARAYAARANAHFWSKDPARARADAERAIELDPELAQAYLARALVYVYEREWREAMADADRAVELAPDDEEVWATRGRIYLEGGDANEALDDFERALALDPDWVEGHLLRAEALDALQRYDDAIVALESVLEVSGEVDDVELAESGIADLRRIPSEVDGMRMWSDAYHGFSIAYPAEWRQYVDPGEEVPLLLVGPLDKDYRANVVLSIFEVDFTLPPSKLARLYGPTVDDLPDYELVSERTITVDGRAAMRRVFTWTAVDSRLRDVPVTVVRVYALIDGHVVIFTATTRTEGVEKNERIFDDVIASFGFD